MSAVINAALSLVFGLLVAHGQAEVPVWGMTGVVADFVPQTFMISFATALAITLITRSRLRRGTVRSLGDPEGGWFARMPRNALARAVLIAAGATLALCPLSAGAFYSIQVTSLATPSFLVMKVLYGVALTLLIAPPIVRAALVARVP